MAVNLSNIGPTVDRINAAKSLSKLTSIGTEVANAEDACVGAWLADPTPATEQAKHMCVSMAGVLETAIYNRAQEFSITLEGSGLDIVVGGGAGPGGAAPTPSGVSSPAGATVAAGGVPGNARTFLILAAAAAAAWALWRYTQ